MKTYIRKDAHKTLIKKRVLMANSILAIGIILFLANGCIKEDYPVRLVFPVLTTTAASGVTSTSVTSGGNITSDGGSGITERGICWGNKINPNLADTLNRFATSGTGTGTFSITVDTLRPDRLYHIRAYATNPDGTAYGQDITFTTAPETGK